MPTLESRRLPGLLLPLADDKDSERALKRWDMVLGDGMVKEETGCAVRCGSLHTPVRIRKLQTRPKQDRLRDVDLIGLRRSI